MIDDITQWHYMKKESPKKSGYYQVAVNIREPYEKNLEAVCFWDRNEDDWTDIVLIINMDYEFDDPDAIYDGIYAWADVFLHAPTAHPDETVTINPEDYYLTEGQFKSFLKAYKSCYETEIDCERINNPAS